MASNRNSGSRLTTCKVAHSLVDKTATLESAVPLQTGYLNSYFIALTFGHPHGQSCAKSVHPHLRCLGSPAPLWLTGLRFMALNRRLSTSAPLREVLDRHDPDR